MRPGLGVCEDCNFSGAEFFSRCPKCGSDCVYYVESDDFDEVKNDEDEGFGDLDDAS